MANQFLTSNSTLLGQFKNIYTQKIIEIKSTPKSEPAQLDLVPNNLSKNVLALPNMSNDLINNVSGVHVLMLIPANGGEKKDALSMQTPQIVVRSFVCIMSSGAIGHD